MRPFPSTAALLGNYWDDILGDGSEDLTQFMGFTGETLDTLVARFDQENIGDVMFAPGVIGTPGGVSAVTGGLVKVSHLAIDESYTVTATAANPTTASDLTLNAVGAGIIVNKDILLQAGVSIDTTVTGAGPRAWGFQCESSRRGHYFNRHLFNGPVFQDETNVNTVFPKATSNVSANGTTATVTTSAAHGFHVNEVVEMLGHANDSFNGQKTVTAIPTTTTFQFALAVSASTTAGTVAVPNRLGLPIGYGSSRKLTAAGAEAEVANYGSEPGFAGSFEDNQQVATIYGGYFTIGANEALIGLKSYPFLVNVNTQSPIVSGTRTGGTATLTFGDDPNTSASALFDVGDHIHINYTVPVDWNGDYVVTAKPSATTLQFALAGTTAITTPGHVTTGSLIVPARKAIKIKPAVFNTGSEELGVDMGIEIDHVPAGGVGQAAASAGISNGSTTEYPQQYQTVAAGDTVRCDASAVHLTPAASVTLNATTALATGREGQVIRLFNSSFFTVTFPTTSNVVSTVTGQALVLGSFSYYHLRYTTDDNKWRPVRNNRGLFTRVDVSNDITVAGNTLTDTLSVTSLAVLDSALTNTMTYAERTTAPTNPAASSEWKQYAKADKLVFSYNAAGTMHYNTMDPTTGVITHSLVAP